MIINYDTIQTAKWDADTIPFKNALPTAKENGKTSFCEQKNWKWIYKSNDEILVYENSLFDEIGSQFWNNWCI